MLALFPAFAGAELGQTREPRKPSTPRAPLVLKSSENIANGSYLVQTRARDRVSFNDQFFDPHASKAIREEYENGLEAYEARANAGLVEQADERNYFSSMSHLAKRALDTMTKMKLRIQGKHLRKAVENSNAPREPIAFAAVAASLYTGRTMKFSLMPGVRVHSRIDLKDRAASFTVPLSEMGLVSSVAYNRDSNMTAQLSQRVTNEVSAVVDSSAKGTARLIYSVSF